MAYSIVTKISAKKTAWLKRWINILILVVAIPVMLIAFMSRLLYEIMFFIQRVFSRKKQDELLELYREEIILIDRSNLKVFLVEDETDDVLTRVNERWNDEVYGGSTYLYRVKTHPEIAGLHNSICGYFIREVQGGALLQQLTHAYFKETGLIDSSIIFLNYVDLSLSTAGIAGPFHLFNDQTSQSIKGFNQQETIIIDLLVVADDPPQ